MFMFPAPIADKVQWVRVLRASGSVTVIGILRLVAFRRAFIDPSYDFMNTWGPAYSQIESDLAIISACAPALRPLLSSWFPKLFQSEQSWGAENYFKNTVGGSRGGSKMSKSGNRPGTIPDAFQLQDMGHTRTEIRGESPNGSEEEIMTSNGIMKKTQVRSRLSSIMRASSGDKADYAKVDISYDAKTLSSKESRNAGFGRKTGKGTSGT